MKNIRWEDEPDLDALRRFHALLTTRKQEAIAGLEALEERGSVASAVYLGHVYGRKGSYHDLQKAKYWFAKADDKGYAPASYLLGDILSKLHEYGEAFSAFSRGANKGYAPAIYRLAKMYQDGEGVTKDISQCKRLLESAWSKGHIFAKRDLAGLLITGKFGIFQAARGVMMLLSLWLDIAWCIWMAIKGESPFDERILA